MSNLQGQCPKCDVANEYSNVVCDMCGARLPWAAALDVDRSKRIAAEKAAAESQKAADHAQRQAALVAKRASTPVLPQVASQLLAQSRTPQSDSATIVNNSVSATPIVAYTDSNPFVCIVCGNIHVQKVSALWQSGNWQATSDTTTLGAGHIFGGGDFATMSGGVTNTSGSTQLAQYLAPPPRPNVLPPERIMGIVIGCALICLFSFFIALPLVAICFLVFMSNQSKAKRQLEIWNRQMPRWARLFYCSRCDNFYDPHTRQAAHPAQMRLFLNS